MADAKPEPDTLNVLVMYGSTHGHTGTIASRLKAAIESGGDRAEIVDISLFPETSAADFDAVIVAASIHRAHHQRAMVDWVKHNLQSLDSRPNAFISVSLTAAEDSEEANEATRKAIDDFVHETGWRPDRSEPVAGAIQYREYDMFTRLLVRIMMKESDRPTDTSHDYVLTDWDALDRLAGELTVGFRAH